MSNFNKKMIYKNKIMLISLHKKIVNLVSIILSVLGCGAPKFRKLGLKWYM